MNALQTSIFALALIFGATTLGSSFVFFFHKGLSPRLSSIIMGLASGIMISASVFGLILPSIKSAQDLFDNPYLVALPVIVGFLVGCLFMNLLDFIVPHFHMARGESEGPENKKLSQATKFFLAVTMHNIPEGMAVGFAAGLALSSNNSAQIGAALSLAIGIAIQNVPEGAAVSIPMLDVGFSKPKSFWFGTFSGIVEPIFGVIALFMAAYLAPAVPWLLSIAAGAMFYVTIDELLPSSRVEGHEHFGLWSFLLGFVVMLALEILL